MHPPAVASAGYPFSAVVGQDDLRIALILSAVSPAVGGVLVRGEKGTAKSTMVRALAALLPAVEVVPGCRFSCDPHAPDPGCPDGPHTRDAELSDGPHRGPLTAVRPARLVELPVGATEDRVLGALHLERALAEGITAYEPGLLAAANRGVLYVDEVNLLGDHLVDVLLDAAAMGRSTVEREGISASHAARFVLVGTMNAEEGELRPQLLDRFGLTVEARASRDPATRVEVVRRRLAFDADPLAFAARWAAEETEVGARIARARALLPDVVLTDAALRQVAEVCAAFGVDGMRADLVTARAALAHAAWHGRRVVETDDIRVAARLALPHRARRDPFDAPGVDEERLNKALEAAGDDQLPDDPPPEDDPTPPDPSPSDSTPDSAHEASSPDASTTDPPGPARAPAEQGAEPAAPYRARLLTAHGTGPGVAGRRSRAVTTTGRTVGARPRTPGDRGRCTCSPPSPPPHRTSGRVAERGPRFTSRPTTYGFPYARAARATWSCSSSMPAGRWPPGGDWGKSRPPCYRCWSMPTSGATRSPW